MSKYLAVLTAYVVLGGVSGLTGSQPVAAADAVPAPAADCNRHCLLSILTTYTEALVDNDTSRLAVSPQLRVTSNGALTTLGHGQVWGAVRRIPYRHAFVDPASGAAVFYGTLTNTPTRDAEKWWFYVVRLKIVAQRISEIEEISYDGTLGGTPASSLDLPHTLYDTYLPIGERQTRAQLFAIADKYFDAVTGTLNYHDVPWHPECQRIELGTFTVNSRLGPGSCGGEFKDPKVRWTVRNRRYYIADEERGVVLAIANFMTPPELPNNNGSVVFEAFKIQDGLIRHIEAFFRGNGQLHSGWGDGPGS
ncbi:MAG TPA: hypothetical protein VIY90_03725 [Steroidobacteraceae bacterium]